ncbi:hypothetical protein ACFXHA_25275 [Nocardia sp. NPDC059240]|uniref:hypothetical protein n=1 Tax=Nocardia sp. NPDC059240 TaxID=3346786 RepID=UPI00369C89FD
MLTAADRTSAGLRGLAAGSVSGAVAVHGWSVETASPNLISVPLLALSSAGVGALVTGWGPVRRSRLGLIVALILGQTLGHVVIGLESGHARTHELWPSTTSMLVHLCAAIALALVICGMEAAYRFASAALSRALPLRYHPPAIPEALRPFTIHRDRVILRIFGVAALYGRAPPRLAHV